MVKEEELRRAARQALVRIQKDDEIEGDIESKDLSAIIALAAKDDVEENDKNLLNRFRSFVATILEKGNSSKAEKIIKVMDDKLKDEILKFSQDNDDDASTTSNGDNGKAKESHDDEEGAQLEEEATQQPKKRATKKRKSTSRAKAAPKPKKNSKKKKAKTAQDDNLYQVDLERERFEKEKEEILSIVPKGHQDNWGQIGFVKWAKQWRPVVLQSPYSVPPNSQMRDQWMTMFRNCQEDPKRMTFLCYWYGTDNPGEAYTFQQRRTIILHNEGVKKDFHLVPKTIQRKLDRNKKLTKAERELVNGLKVVEEELTKKPEDRVLVPVREFHEQMLDEGLDIEIADDDEEEQLLSDEDGSDPEGESEEPRPEKKMTVKKPKETKKPTKKKPVDENKMSAAEEVELDFAENEMSDKEDKDDGSVEIPHSDGDEDMDMDGSEAVSSTKASKKRKPVRDSKSGPKKQKTQPKKKEEIDESLLSADELAEKRKREVKLGKERERKSFNRCKKHFSDMIEKFEKGINESDANSVIACLKEIKKDVGMLSAPFIEVFDLPQLMKRAKILLKSDRDAAALRKDVWEDMKKTYLEKRGRVPKEFKPPSRHPVEPVKKVPKVDATKTKREQPSESKREDSSVNGRSKPTENGVHDTKETTTKEDVKIKQEADSDGAPLEPPKLKKRKISMDDAPKKTELKRTTTPPPPKPPKRKTSMTSLKSLLSGPKAKRESLGRTQLNGASKPTMARASIEKKLPKWLTSGPVKDESFSDSDETRFLGLEFLKEASSQLSKQINQDGFSRSIETALHQHCKNEKKDEWKPTYWEKILAIVAALGGKYKVGGLTHDLTTGKYLCPEDIIKLPVAELDKSFLN